MKIGFGMRRGSTTRRSVRRSLQLFGLMTVICGAASVGNAALVLHLDPNNLSTLFGAGGLGSPVGIGDTSRWVTDVRSPTPGGTTLDSFIDAEGNADSPTVVAHPTQGSVWEFNGTTHRMLMKRVNATVVGGQQTGFGAVFDTNTLTAIIVGRAVSNGVDNDIDHMFDLYENGTTDFGFGLSYDHTTQQLNGFANQVASPVIAVPHGEWYVATYAWDGPNTTMTLTVETQSGITTVSDTSAPGGLLNAVSEIRFGRKTGAAPRGEFRGNIGDFMIYNDAGDHSGVASELAEEYLHTPQLIINRDTGTASFTRASGGDLTNVVGYTIHSPSETLTPTGWLSIADNYDSDSPGPEQLDPNNVWLTTSDPNSRTELSEEESTSLGGAANGATFVVGDPADFGTIWTQYYQEDVTIELMFDNGDTRTVNAIFEGNEGEAFQYGDLNFDGLVNAADFTDIFRPNYGADTSSLVSGPERYVLGDMNEDGVVTYSDFFRLKNAIIAATPEDVALLTFTGNVQVPEPGSLLLLTFALAAGWVGRQRFAHDSE